ncbi:hypothetical protein [uncultured Mediterranean phage]|nr:hypothetical protein [uncultured Mediterranean phage]
MAHENILPTWAQKALVWAFGFILIAAVSAGGAGLRTSWANEDKIARQEKDIDVLKRESKETHDTVLENRKDLEHITKGIERIEQALERQREND